ncbi:MAG TPA: GGDEF domain-containing protein, partial [Acetobacterium sp.]|nr:GGDEF domain-containing protein [Acetobacterium sp.]
MRQAVENGDYPITLAITLSIGISGSRADDHARNVFKLVDDAMYRAKKTGKNQIVCV